MAYPSRRERSPTFPSGSTPMYSPEIGTEDGPVTPFSPYRPWLQPQASPQSGSFYLPPTTGQYGFAGNSACPSTIPAAPMNYPPWNNAAPISVPPALLSMLVNRPSEPFPYVAGYASEYIPPAIAAVSQPGPPQEHTRDIVAYPPVPIPPTGTGDEHEDPASSEPEHVLHWEYVRHNAVVVDGPRVFVPQKIYQPHSPGDKERYVSAAKLQRPIIFIKPSSYEWGIPLQYLLLKEPAQLRGGDEPAFTACGPSIGIRVLWPGYPSWHKQVSTKDYTSRRNVITKERLAKLVGRSVKQCMDAMSEQVGSNPEWRVGPQYIRVNDIILVSLHHVSQGSWQPHLRLHIPTNPVFVPFQDHRAIAGPSTGMYP